MKQSFFDFTCDRRGSNCVKWDECADPDLIPMWVADMDFRTAPCIVEALHKRVEHGVFGYNIVPDSFYQAIINWQEHRHGWTIQREWIQFTIGVVPALSAIIKSLTQPGDGVLIQTPVYNCFFSSIRNNGCRIVEAPLTWNPEEEHYTVDLEAFERIMVDQHVRLFLLCNPHNPACHVWTCTELRQMADICKRHDVIVVADEIHCEFINPALSRAFQPFAPVAEDVGVEWVVANAPSKAFNTAGLQIAYIVCRNEAFRQRIDRSINDNEVCDVNPFGIVALEAAYSQEGEAWLNSLLAYIYENYRVFRQMMKAALPSLPIARLEGTYLAWVDVSSITKDTMRLSSHMRNIYKVWVNPGEMYGSAGFLRVNLACPRELMRKGTQRLINGLTNDE